jgi:hypothetical protein
MTSVTPPTDYRLNDTHRRIRNILGAHPATEWNIYDAKAVLVVLSAIYRGSDDSLLSGRLDAAGEELKRLAAVLVCDRCDTAGWLWPPIPEQLDDEYTRMPIECDHK